MQNDNARKLSQQEGAMIKQACDNLVFNVSDKTQFSRYYDPHKGICVVVARDHAASQQLSQYYDMMIQRDPDDKKTAVIPIPMTPLADTVWMPPEKK